MTTMNMIIAKNIEKLLDDKNINIGQLAERIGMSLGKMRELIDGGVRITLKIQQEIAGVFGVEPFELTRPCAGSSGENIIHAMMGRVDTQAAKDAIEQADEISNYILFYRESVSAGYEMEKAWM